MLNFPELSAAPAGALQERRVLIFHDPFPDLLFAGMPELCGKDAILFHHHLAWCWNAALYRCDCMHLSGKALEMEGTLGSPQLEGAKSRDRRK